MISSYGIRSEVMPPGIRLTHSSSFACCRSEAASWRYRQMIEHNGGPLSPYDQQLWNTLGSNASRNSADSLQLFRLLRENNLHMFDQLTDEQWNSHGIHAERGEMSVRDLMQQLAGHDLNHMEQIRNILTTL